MGPEHPETVTALYTQARFYTLARFYHEQGRFEQAEPLYQRALKTRELLQEPDHPDTVMLLENYADLLQKMKREAEAATFKSPSQSDTNEVFLLILPT